MMNRRQSLGLLAGAAMAAGAGPAGAAAHGTGEGNWTRDPEGLLRGLMKLRASLDDRMTLEWFKGIVYGVVESSVTPFFTVNAVAFAWYARAEDGSYRGRRAEVTYHGDLATDRRISAFENPYNGSKMDVPLSRTPAMDAVIDRTGLVLPARMGPLRLEAQPSLGPALVNGERCWIRLDTRSKVYAPGNDQPLTVYNESLSYAGRSADLDDKSVLSAPCQISYNNLMSWRDWMRMDGIPGHSITVASGEKVLSLAEVPGELRDFVEQQHPDLAKDPRAALAAAPAVPG